MKLKEFNRVNTPNGKKGIPFVSFNTTSGVIRLNNVAVELLKISKGDHVVLLQDEDKPKDWYVGASPEGFAVRPQGKTNNMAFGSHVLTNAVLTSLNVLDKSIRINIATTAVTVNGMPIYPLITLPIVNKGRPTSGADTLRPKRF